MARVRSSRNKNRDLRVTRKSGRVFTIESDINKSKIEKGQSVLLVEPQDRVLVSARTGTRMGKAQTIVMRAIVESIDLSKGEIKIKPDRKCDLSMMHSSKNAIADDSRLTNNHKMSARANEVRKYTGGKKSFFLKIVSD